MIPELKPLYVALVVVAWLLVYHVAYSLVAILRDPSLVCWSIGPLGIRVVGLREPPLYRLLAQVALAAAALALVAYLSLFVVQPPLITGLQQSLSTQIGAVGLPVAVVTLAHLVRIFVGRRFPIWGEAGVLVRVQRSVASGAVIIFTPAGRAFLHERFGATPGEFLRLVRI